MRGIYVPLWCYCHWGGSGPVWLSSFPLVWFHWTQIQEWANPTCSWAVKNVSSMQKQEMHLQFCHIFQDHIWNTEWRIRSGTIFRVKRKIMQQIKHHYKVFCYWILTWKGYWQSHRNPAGCRRFLCLFSWRCEFWSRYICPQALRGERKSKIRDLMYFLIVLYFFFTVYTLLGSPLSVTVRHFSGKNSKFLWFKLINISNILFY